MTVCSNTNCDRNAVQAAYPTINGAEIEVYLCGDCYDETNGLRP